MFWDIGPLCCAFWASKVPITMAFIPQEKRCVGHCVGYFGGPGIPLGNASNQLGVGRRHASPTATERESAAAEAHVRQQEQGNSPPSVGPPAHQPNKLGDILTSEYLLSLRMALALLTSTSSLTLTTAARCPAENLPLAAQKSLWQTLRALR